MKNTEKMKAAWGSIYVPGGRNGVLLVHSLGGSPIELKFVAHTLAQLGYTVYCPLLPGLAGGTDVSGLSTWQDWYAALFSYNHADWYVIKVLGVAEGYRRLAGDDTVGPYV